MFESFKGETTWGLKVLAERPKLAAHIGLIVGMWATVESRLSHMLSIILHSDAEIGATLFSVIKAEGGRFAMIRAIAEDRLTPEQQAEYSALKKRIESVGSYRDAIAHNIWAISEDHPDSLILFDAKASARFMAILTKDLATVYPTEKHQYDFIKSVEDRKKSARKYTEKEFLHIEAEITAVAAEIADFSSRLYLSSPWQPLEDKG
jgi:hypothetical protein